MAIANPASQQSPAKNSIAEPWTSAQLIQQQKQSSATKSRITFKNQKLSQFFSPACHPSPQWLGLKA
jgi:hypothetical protein